jgi:tRNA threonylcarbamoyladenosine biosynthesis protein TsaB
VLVLGLDTTTRGGSVAVLQNDDVLALVEGDVSRTHGERLPGEIDLALRRAGVDRRALDLLAVASGPGAFTGLRIGLAAIQGMAMVLDTPVVGVSALAALAAIVREANPSVRHIVTWMDAQRQEVFSAAFAAADDAEVSGEVTEPIVDRPEAALRAVPFSREDHVVFIGDGALRYRELIADAWGDRGHVFDLVPPLAPAIARLARRAAIAGYAGPPHALQPLYVRRPDAVLDRERQTQS